MPLHFKKQGSGEPLVLIHGLFGSLANLGAVARFLAERYTVLSVDLPNHGQSPHTRESDLEGMVALLRRWMDQQQLASARFAGHSLGGKVAMELALCLPRRVRELVVMDISPVHYDAHHTQIFQALLEIDLGRIRSRDEADSALRIRVPEFAVRSFLLKNLHKSSTGQFQWRMNLPIIHQHYPDLIRENARGKIFAGKTLFLKGGASDYIGESHRQAIVERFPRAHLKIVANAGHWLHAEKPQLVAKLIDNFFADRQASEVMT